MEPPSSIPVSSPDMFDSDDDYAKNKSSPIKASPKKLTKKLSKDEMIIKSDIYLMKKLNESLGGIPPPPKYTICQRNCADLLQKIKENSQFFYTNNSSSSLKNISSQNCVETVLNSRINQGDNLGTFQTVIDETQLKNLTWPLAYEEKAFGIHYNRNKYVEYIDSQSVRLCDRYIGNDTQSSFTTSLTSNINIQKKPPISKRGVGQSPGKRLSHLAKRRRVFSIANLQKMNDKKPHCLISVKKSVMKKSTSPRKINRTSPKILPAKLSTRRWSVQSQNSASWKLKTPPCCLAHSSPIHHTKSSNKKITNNDFNNQTHRIKRSLFSTPVKVNVDGKKSIDDLNNKNCNEYDNLKSSSSVSSNQSTKDAKNKINSSTKIGAKKMDDIDRKKLVWAVSQALKSKGIDTTHVKFQYYGRQLVKKVKEVMPYLENHDIPRKPGSTTERMLAHAKKYAFLLVDDRGN